MIKMTKVNPGQGNSYLPEFVQVIGYHSLRLDDNRVVVLNVVIEPGECKRLFKRHGAT